MLPSADEAHFDFVRPYPAYFCKADVDAGVALGPLGANGGSRHWRQRRRRTVLYLTDDPEAVAFIIGNVSRIRAFEVGGGDCAKQRGAPSTLDS